MRVQIDTHYLPGWTDLLGKIERRNAMPRSHVQNRCPWKKIKMLEQRFGKRRRPGIMLGERPGRHGSLSMSNDSPQTYSLRARAQDGWQCGSLAESGCDILRRTRNGSPLLKRFHQRGRPKGLSLLFPVLVNELECVELGLQLLNTFIPLLNLFLERLHLA